MHWSGKDIDFGFGGGGGEILILCKIYTPALRSNHDLKGRYPYIRVVTFVPMHIKDTMTKAAVFVVSQHLEYKQERKRS